MRLNKEQILWIFINYSIIDFVYGVNAKLKAERNLFLQGNILFKATPWMVLSIENIVLIKLYMNLLSNVLEVEKLQAY